MVQSNPNEILVGVDSDLDAHVSRACGLLEVGDLTSLRDGPSLRVLIYEGSQHALHRRTVKDGGS